MVVGSMTLDAKLLVIGGGPGGYVAALRAAMLGLDVTLVEETNIGGVCLNTGCIPTKAIIHASNYFNTLKELQTMGINVEKFDVDIKKMSDWKQGIVDKLKNNINFLLKKHGVEVIEGRAVFKSENEVRIEGKSDVTAIKFEKCIVSTGSSSINVKGFEFGSEGIWSSDDALSLNEIPKKLIIIGGGYIGTEIGTIYGKLGCQVEIVEFQDRLISILDSEIVKVVQDKLKNFNITVNLNSKALSYEKQGDSFKVKIESNGEVKELVGDKILVVVGRTPNTKNIGLTEANVKLTEKGFIEVDVTQKTSNPNIYAVGDVCGEPLLAHKAIRQGKVAAEVIANLKSAYDNKVVPSVVFNDPELCSVGLTEDEAKSKGIEYDVGRFNFTASGRAHTLNDTTGFIKLLARKDSGIIIGMQGVGASISNIVGEIALAIETGLTAEDLSLTIHPHPTISEALMEAADDLLKTNVHK